MFISNSVLLQLNNLSCDFAETEFEFAVHDANNAKLEFLLSCSLEGRHSHGETKVTLMRKN